MLEIENKRYMFKTKQIWFCDYPFDIKKYSGVTFHACRNNVDAKGFDKREFTTIVIDLTLNLDQIWSNLKKSRKYSITKAKKDGVVVKINQHYKEFYKINTQFRKSKGLPSADVDIEFMEKFGTLFVAEFEGEILGGQLYLEDENNIRWLIGASKRLEADKQKITLIGNANSLIIWKAIEYAKNKGIKEYDMGGYYAGSSKDEQMERINYFKKGFGGELVTHYIYHKDYSKTYKLGKILISITRKAKVLHNDTKDTLGY